jgi:hypothetical protein
MQPHKVARIREQPEVDLGINFRVGGRQKQPSARVCFEDRYPDGPNGA